MIFLFAFNLFLMLFIVTKFRSPFAPVSSSVPMFLFDCKIGLSLFMMITRYVFIYDYNWSLFIMIIR